MQAEVAKRATQHNTQPSLSRELTAHESCSSFKCHEARKEAARDIQYEDFLALCPCEHRLPPAAEDSPRLSVASVVNPPTALSFFLSLSLPFLAARISASYVHGRSFFPSRSVLGDNARFISQPANWEAGQGEIPERNFPCREFSGWNFSRGRVEQPSTLLGPPSSVESFFPLSPPPPLLLLLILEDLKVQE